MGERGDLDLGESCTGECRKGSWGPGWGWLCGCATCIVCCGCCPRWLVKLTALSSCWYEAGLGAWIDSRLRPLRSRLMPERLCRRTGLAGRTLGISNALGVDSWRLCCIRRREMPWGELVLDSILMLVESGCVVRGRVSCRVRYWAESAQPVLAPPLSISLSPTRHTSRKYKRRSAGRVVSSRFPQYSAVSQSLRQVSISGRSLCRSDG